MKHLIGIIMAVVLTVTSAYALERVPVRPDEGVRIEVVAEDGSTLVSLPFRDFNNGWTRIVKTYLEARKGQIYAIVVRNLTPDRIGVVIAVDGRNIISGKQSELKNSEEMYVIGGYGYARLDGWRTDSSTVHKFYFTEAPDSYTVRTFNDSSAMGVIAAAVYREKKRPIPAYSPYKSDSSTADGSFKRASKAKAGAVMEESAGTGFGDAHYSPVVHVSFEPESAPILKQLIKYEWHETLCRKGILSCGQKYSNRLWDEGDYAPFPPGYNKR